MARLFTLIALIVIPSAYCRAELKRWGVVEAGKVYRGSHPSTEDDFRWLQSKGIRTIVSLQTWARHRRPEAAMAKRFGITFKYSPVSGLPTPPSEKSVNLALDLLHDPANQPVYVHCYLGRDRTGMISALYQIYFMGVLSETAYHDQMEAYGWKDVPWLHGIMTYYKRHDDAHLRQLHGRRGD